MDGRETDGWNGTMRIMRVSEKMSKQRRKFEGRAGKKANARKIPQPLAYRRHHDLMLELCPSFEDELVFFKVVLIILAKVN